MIIGGVDAAARATSERVGYTTTYLPMSARVIPAAVKSAIEGNGVLQYHASARIRNVADNAWVDLSPVTYFQINLDNRGTQDSADVTIAQPETWSPYLAGVYADLLKPSTRVLQISCGITAGGTQYTQRIFRGHITEYQEPHG
ncbi:MAG: hypothetical protein RLZZ524_369, partial [Pseudomonadota bacterium]